jgi:hypothetical protein
VVKRKCYGNREKCYESNCNVIVQKKILPKKLSNGGGGGGGGEDGDLKCCVVRKIFLARTLHLESLGAWPTWVFAGPF